MVAADAAFLGAKKRARTRGAFKGGGGLPDWEAGSVGAVGRLGRLGFRSGFLFGDFFVGFVGSFFEFLDGLAKPLGEFRKFLGSEKEQNYGENEKEFHAAQTKDAGDDCGETVHRW